MSARCDVRVVFLAATAGEVKMRAIVGSGLAADET
jgi:hypothetical protein